MNEQIYKKNCELMKKKFPELTRRLQNWKKKRQNDTKVILDTAKDGQVIFSVIKNEKEYYLNGRYCPEGPIKEWLQNQKKFEKESLIILVGLGSLIELREILEQTNYKVNILVYEPSIEVFFTALQNVDMEVLFTENPIGIVIEGLNEEELEQYFALMIKFDNLSLMLFYLSGNYDELFREEVKNFSDKLKQYLERILVKTNTQIRYTTVNGRNTFENVGFYYNQYSAYSLQKILPDGIPVFLVAAGPSLNKNIMELKKAKGKSCIIAADTALKPLLNAGIFPDFVTIVDGLKPTLLFEHKDFSKVPMVAFTTVSNEVMHLHHGKKFLCWDGDEFEREMFYFANKRNDVHHKYNNLIIIPTGGSVAHLSFSLAQYMGAKTIIFVGQDLALTNGCSHADGTFADKMEKLDLQKKEYIEVDGINGGKVITREDFNRYRKWFEEQISKNNRITYINATEGGAMIKGAKVEKLSDAVKKYCKSSIDMQEILDEVPELFDANAKKEVIRFWENMSKKLSGLEQKIRFGFNSYKKLYLLLEKDNVTKEALLSAFDKIRRFNDYTEKNIYMALVLDSIRGVEAFFRTGVFQTENTTKEELSAIAKQGMLITEKMFYALQELREIYQDTIGNFSEERWLKEEQLERKEKKGKILLIFNSKKQSIHYIRELQKKLCECNKYVYLLNLKEKNWKEEAIAYQYFTDAMPFEAIIDFGGMLQSETLKDEMRKKQRYIFENEITPYYVLKDGDKLEEEKYEKRKKCVIEYLGFTITTNYEKEKKEKLIELLFMVLDL